MSDSVDYRYAGFWIRVLASLIDSVLIFAILLPVMLTLYGSSFFGDMMAGTHVQSPFEVVFTYILPAIAITLFWIYRSATPGKMMLKLKVIRLSDGRRVNLKQAAIRYLGYYLCSIPLFLGFFWIAFDEKKQGWHDKLAGTVVIVDQSR